MSRRVVLPLDRQCELLHFPKPVAEFRFCSRRWRFDWAWVDIKLAVEVDGGAFLPGGGRHTRGAGFVRDLEKSNGAVLAGWRVLRFTPSQIANGEALPVIALALRRLEHSQQPAGHCSGD